MTIRSSSRVRDIDRGFRQYRREVSTVSVPALAVGVTEESGRARHQDNGATAAEVALFAEYGTMHQAPTPFLRGAADDGSVARELSSAARATVAAGPSESSARTSLEELGRVLADGIRSRVEAAGLVDEGVLRDAISHEVRS